MAFLITKKLPINEPFVLRITQEDSPIRNCGSIMSYHVSMNWDRSAKFHYTKTCSHLLETMTQGKILLEFRDWCWTDVRSRFNITLQRWQALSPPSLYRHTVASSRSASFNPLDSLISDSEAKQQIGELTELHLGLDRRSINFIGLKIYNNN